MTKTLKVFELAAKIKCNSSEIISIAKKLNIEVFNIRSKVTPDDAEKIKTYLKENTKDDYEIFREEVEFLFYQMKNTDDLVDLINYANSYNFGENAEKVELKNLTFYAFHSEHRYKTFNIPKKTEGFRKIYAPVKPLKNILKSLNLIFHCIYTSHEDAHGFSKNKSVITNAKKHLNKNYIYNIDLKDYFPNIKQARVWRRLQLEPFNLNGEERIKIANLISNLVCYQVKNENKKNFLPQGFPTSPLISNAISEKLDMKLRRLSKKYNIKYSRYADDITFSSNKNIFKKNKNEKGFIHELQKIIEKENFEVNESKIRLQKKDVRQEVSGIIVNEKLNVNRKYIKELRGIIYIIEKFGIEKASNIFIRKKIKNKKLTNLKKIKKLLKNKNNYGIKYVIGKLEYLKNVKGENDSTYIKLNERFNRCITHQIEEKVHDPKKLIKILSLFTKGNSNLKFTTHIWDLQIGNDTFNSYDDFIKSIKDEYSLLSDDLSKLSRRLRSKIWNFLFNNNFSKNENNEINKGWGQYGIQFGWSSPELAEWCKEKTNPFSYVLDKKYQKEINNKKLYDFMDVVEVFKNEIEIRSSVDRFNQIILEKRKYLGADFKVKKINTDNIGFFTDVQWFELGLLNIFEEIKKRIHYPNIIIDVKKNIDNYEIRIIQQNSLPLKKAEDMFKEVNSGNFLEIKNAFYSLCDWSIEAKFTNGNYRVNFLNQDESRNKIEELKNTPDGFTHLMRFYI